MVKFLLFKDEVWENLPWNEWLQIATKNLDKSNKQIYTKFQTHMESVKPWSSRMVYSMSKSVWFIPWQINLKPIEKSSNFGMDLIYF